MHTEPRPLPWSDHAARATANLTPWFEERLPAGSGEYPPGSIFVYADEEVLSTTLTGFLDDCTQFFTAEIRRRLARQQRFVDMGLFAADELREALTANRHLQPWLLDCSRDGGVGPIDWSAAPDRVPRGYKPCSSMINHGLAWQREDEQWKTWLVTARRPGEGWDWDSDLGHESAHAAFAPVPLFTQVLKTSTVPIADLSSSGLITDGHLARLGYPFSELSVVAVRGEPRSTETQLPVLETPEILNSVLELAAQLMPGLGFDRALAAANRTGGVVDVNGGDEIYEIAAPVLRLMPSLARISCGLAPPTIEWDPFDE